MSMMDRKSNTTTDTRERMKFESFRLETFSTFPTYVPVKPTTLAATGFYYEGKHDEVTCFSCNMKYRGWKMVDLPELIHKHFSPRCPFLIGISSGNICVEPSWRLSATPEDKHQQNSYFDKNAENSNNQNSLQEGKHTSNYRYPQFAIYEARLKSFTDWPKEKSQSPQQLTEAGFFYEGQCDCVRCFFCGGGLQNWDQDDDPWVEHAHWFPHCIYLRKCKGNEFITLVRVKVQSFSSYGSKEDKKYTTNVKRIKEKDDILSQSASLSVLEMGYSQDLVQRAFRKLLKTKNIQTITASDLLEEIFVSENALGDKKDHGSVSKDENENIVEKKHQGNRGKDKDDSEIKALREENRRLKDMRSCKICLDEVISAVFLPCGHMVTCESCAPAIRKCPTCRVHIEGTVKAILG